VYANGFELLNNQSRISEVRQRGFTHAIVLDSTSPAALKHLAQHGLAAVINVGWGLHPCGEEASDCCYSNGTQERCRKYSPLVNATYYASRVARVASVLHKANGWAAAAYNDIEIPPWPSRTFGADGRAAVYNFSDLPERIDRSASPTAWPSFADWPCVGAHRLRSGQPLGIKQIQYNLPQRSVSTIRSVGKGDGTTLQVGGDVHTIAQRFRANSSRITQIDVQMWRHSLAPPENGQLDYFIATLDAQGRPEISKPGLCRSRASTREPPRWINCSIRPSELPPLLPAGASPEKLSLYVDPSVTSLTVGKEYALVFTLQVDVHSKHPPLAVSIAGQNTKEPADAALTWNPAQGTWVSTTTVVFAEFFAPTPVGTDTFESVCPSPAMVGTLHGDWVAYQCWITALQVDALAKLAATHVVYNSTRPDKHMEVWAYSGYSGIGIYSPGISSYLGAVQDTMGVDWAAMATAGLDVAVAGYGKQNITATRSALCNASSQVALVCGSKSSQAVFSSNYQQCDGAMEFERAGSRTPFDDDFGFRVPVKLASERQLDSPGAQQ
jgi:hypothetical protein